MRIIVLSDSHRFLEYAEDVIAISKSFGIDAQIVGRVEECDKTELIIKSEFGEFRY